jgi:hypothetical protein
MFYHNLAPKKLLSPDPSCQPASCRILQSPSESNLDGIEAENCCGKPKIARRVGMHTSHVSDCVGTVIVYHAVWNICR